jgi:hypothetical protein
VINVVGLGTQDSLDLAKKFRSRHKVTSVKMLWDATGSSWNELGVPGQPAWLLFGKGGDIINGDVGPIPYSEVLDQIK